MGRKLEAWTTEPTLSSETSAFILQTPGKFPKDHRLHSKHGESLKTTIRHLYGEEKTRSMEDGTDIEFRNVGFYTSDAGEIPKRT